jgi:hypothetical protein
MSRNTWDNKETLSEQQMEQPAPLEEMESAAEFEKLPDINDPYWED